MKLFTAQYELDLELKLSALHL